MKPRILCVLLLMLTAVPAKLWGEPIRYDIFFTLTTVNTGLSGLRGRAGETFSIAPVVGDVFRGNFTLDDEQLSSPGPLIGLTLDAFRIEIAGLVWDMNDAASAFLGFRGPSLFAPSPVIVAGSNGAITGLRGGVFGRADVPFVDFYNDQTFWAADVAGNGLGGLMSLRRGALSAPSTAGLMFLGIVGLGLLAMGLRRKT